MNELDQPKFSRKYKLSKKKELNENINKNAEDEKIKAKNIENESKSGKTSVKKNKQTPSKIKKKQNKKNDDDIEMKDDTVKNRVKKESKKSIT